MTSITHRIGIKSSAAQVYQALSTIDGLAGWWTKDTSGASRVGSTIEFRFRGPDGQVRGGMDMQVEAQEPGAKVLWRCKAGPADWIGTELSFDLKQDGEQTIVLFSHRGFEKPTEFVAHCSMKWATFLLSLKALVETGTGRPAPEDVKIDNWN